MNRPAPSPALRIPIPIPDHVGRTSGAVPEIQIGPRHPRRQLTANHQGSSVGDRPTGRAPLAVVGAGVGRDARLGPGLGEAWVYHLSPSGNSPAMSPLPRLERGYPGCSTSPTVKHVPRPRIRPSPRCIQHAPQGPF